MRILFLNLDIRKQIMSKFTVGWGGAGDYWNEILKKFKGHYIDIFKGYQYSIRKVSSL